MCLRFTAAVFLVVVWLAQPVRVFAQRVYAGPFIGLAHSSFQSRSVGMLEDGDGYLFGAFIGLPLKGLLSVELGMNLYPYSDNKYSAGTTYLNVPVVLMAEFPRKSVVKARARAGLQFTFRRGSPELALPLGLGLGVGRGEHLNVFLDLGGWIGISNVDFHKSGPVESVKHDGGFLVVGVAFGLR